MKILNINKSDIFLIIILLVIIIFLLLLNNNDPSDKALVYYENDLILTIDLNKDDIYQVNGENGIVEIEVKDNKIKVNEENSPYHLCSKQGYIDKKGQSIICLPNKIIIKLENDTYDTEVR